MDKIARERIAALDRLLMTELRRLDDAIAVFVASTAERFVAGNEFRQSLNDVQTQMATRRELEAFQGEYRNAHSDLLQVVADLRTTLAVGPTELRELVNHEARVAGRNQGVQFAVAQLFALVGLVAVVAGTVGHFLK